MSYDHAKAAILDKVEEAAEHLNLNDYAHLLRDISEHLLGLADSAEEEL